MTQKAILNQELIEMQLTPAQLKGVMQSYKGAKTYKNCIDMGVRFQRINDRTLVRDFKIAASTEVRRARGVYKITFDSNAYYIGRSKLIGPRLNQHQHQLESFFEKGTYDMPHYFQKVFDYLSANPMCYYFSVEILEACYTVEELTTKEQKWLLKSIQDPNCLNVSFVAKKCENEIEETISQHLERKKSTGVYKRNGRTIFYAKKEVAESILNKRTNPLLKSTEAKKEKANSFSFNVPEIESQLGPTVFKLYYGDRFIVHKGKTLAGSIFLLQKGYGYYESYDHSKDKVSKDYYYAFYEYIRKHPGKNFKVEVILTSQNPLDILIAEYNTLQTTFKNKKCLNANIEVYIPVFNEKTKMNGWIPPKVIDEFYSAIANT